MIDTHCHLTYDPLHADVDSVIRRAVSAGVNRMISIGTGLDDSLRAAALAESHPEVFSTVGIHPHYAGEPCDAGRLREVMTTLAAQPRVVALGEMGLDRHYPDPPMDQQRRVLTMQLDVARAIDLPIVIHNREATDEVLSILRDAGLAPERFVFHCFTGAQAELDAILDFGAMVSFTGIVTFNSARELAQAAATVPADRLMIETDAPYLTPEPHRKVRPNQPCYVPHVATFLARLRGVPEGDFIQQVDANARRFFRLPA